MNNVTKRDKLYGILLIVIGFIALVSDEPISNGICYGTTIFLGAWIFIADHIEWK